MLRRLSLREKPANMVSAGFDEQSEAGLIRRATETDIARINENRNNAARAS
jgi:hypothetical protein